MTQRDRQGRPLLARLWAPLRERLLHRLWFMPIVGAVAAVLISVATLAIDRTLTNAGVALPIVAAAPTQIATLYSVIAASILNLLALVFTILIVVLQLTSSQYSHRALRTLLQDRQSRVTLGIFVATFMHALIVLAALGTAGHDDRVAGVSVTSTLVLSIVSIAAFLLFIDHITQSIRVTSIINAIGKETRDLIDHLYGHGDVPSAASAPTPDSIPDVVMSSKAGVVASVDVDGLVDSAERGDVLLKLVPAVGDFVPRGAPLLQVYGNGRPTSCSDRSELDDCARFIRLKTERMMEDDVAFGLRQLVDVAQRALSPGTNDPTIAVHAINQIHDLLRALSTRALSNGVYCDEQGDVRLVVPRPTWDDYVSLATDEVRHYGANSVQVTRRLRAMLEDLLEVAPPERRQAIQRQVALLDKCIERSYSLREERVIASQPDPQGHGSPRVSGDDERFVEQQRRAIRRACPSTFRGSRRGSN